MKMRMIALSALAFGLAVGMEPSLAWAGWRSGIESLPPTRSVHIDGRATEWQEWPLAEVGGLSFRAMNDATNVYLLIRGANDDGRTLLSGLFRENVTIWFLKLDHRTKDWGIDIDFSKAHVAEPVIDSSGVPHARETIGFEEMGITPEMIRPEGLEISTDAFPSGFLMQADLSSEHGRQPIIEIQIPKTMLTPHHREVYFDLLSSDVPPEVKAELVARQVDQNARTGNAPSGGSTSGLPGGGGFGRHGRHGGGGGGGGSHGAEPLAPPKPIHLEMTITLTKR